MAESYTVVRRFLDQSHNRTYHVGEQYPATGHKATKARLKELSTTSNKYGQVYITLKEGE